MKALKLGGIFILMVAAIALALNWGSIFNHTNDDEGFAQKDKLDIKKECEKIRKAWDSQSEWSKELYEHQRADIDQSKGMGLFSMEGYNTVNNCLRESATNKACATYLAELKKTDFKHASLKNRYEAVEAMKKAEQLNDDPRIKNVEDIHSLYTKIRKFANSNHTISPEFRTETTDWDSFLTKQNRILSIADSYSKNPIYQKELKQIPGFENALDQTKLKNITSAQRPYFYKNLAQQIVNYFYSIEVNKTNINLLNQIYNNYLSQGGEDAKNNGKIIARCIVDLEDNLGKN